MNTILDSPTMIPLTRGSRLGQYLIRRLLQHGGMSSVYLAYDEYTYTTVAIKVIEVKNSYFDGSSMDNNDQVAQFRRERRIMKSLHHDHILPLLGAGRQGAYAYLVMPYIPGGTLKDRLEQGPLAPAEAHAIFVQLAAALHYMHEFGILHRDIKPANILLDCDSSVYLTDFGIAAYTDESAIEHNGRVMGTPMYMAPELCYGHASIASDIYALGILLYQMLTGQAPFEGSDSWGVCVRQIEEQPVRPSQLNPSISHPVEQVILCALEKEVTLRFATVTAFTEAYETAYTPSSLFEKVHALVGTIVSSLGTHFQGNVDKYNSLPGKQYKTEAMLAW